MSLIQLIYTSRPFGFDAAILSHILMTARRNNAREQITGALICRADIYLQLLEGPEAAVSALYRQIARDDRHLEVTERLRRPVTARMFPGWAMRHDPAHSWFWSQSDVDAGAADRAGADDYIAMFARLPATD